MWRFSAFSRIQISAQLPQRQIIPIIHKSWFPVFHKVLTKILFVDKKDKIILV